MTIVTMTFPIEPSGLIEWIRPPLQLENDSPKPCLWPSVGFASTSSSELQSCCSLSPPGFERSFAGISPYLSVVGATGR